MRPLIQLSTIVIVSNILLTGCARSNSRVRTYQSSSPAVSSTYSSPSSTTYTTSTTETTVEPASTITEQPVTITEQPAERQSVRTASREEPAIRNSPYSITYDEFRTNAKDRTALIVDARSPDQYALGHVRGAINIPAGQKQSARDRHLQNVSRDQLIIIYCSSASCGSSDMLAESLISEGFTNVRVFSPGWQVLSHSRDLR